MATVIGRLLTRMNQAQEAEVWAERAVASARGGGNFGAEVFALAALAEAEDRLGRHERAASSARDATALIRPDSDPRLRAAVAYARAQLALSRNDLREAQTSAAALLEAIGYPDPLKVHAFQLADVNLLLAARIALAAGDPADAAQMSNQALELATAAARDPHRSATVGEAQLVLARARDAQHDRNGAHQTIHEAARALAAGLSPDHPLALEAAALEARL
jgi:tetratricopeptide (TPR) repeat protein